MFSWASKRGSRRSDALCKIQVDKTWSCCVEYGCAFYVPLLANLKRKAIFSQWRQRHVKRSDAAASYYGSSTHEKDFLLYQHTSFSMSGKTMKTIYDLWFTLGKVIVFLQTFLQIKEEAGCSYQNWQLRSVWENHTISKLLFVQWSRIVHKKLAFIFRIVEAYKCVPLRWQRLSDEERYS